MQFVRRNGSTDVRPCPLARLWGIGGFWGLNEDGLWGFGASEEMSWVFGDSAADVEVFRSFVGSRWVFGDSASDAEVFQSFVGSRWVFGDSASDAEVFRSFVGSRWVFGDSASVVWDFQRFLRRRGTLKVPRAASESLSRVSGASLGVRRLCVSRLGLSTVSKASLDTQRPSHQAFALPSVPEASSTLRSLDISMETLVAKQRLLFTSFQASAVIPPSFAPRSASAMSTQTESATSNKFLASLASDSKRQRLRALESLLERLEDLHGPPIQEFFEEVQRPLCRSLCDSSEACRLLALRILRLFLANLPPEAANLDYALPTMARRLGVQELLEQSEELRLEAVKTLRWIVEGNRYTEALKVHSEGLLAILERRVADNHPDVKVESCECLCAFARSVPGVLLGRTERTVEPVLGNLTHQRWRVREAAVRALGEALVRGESKCMDKVAVSLAQRLFDQCGAVRKAVVEVSGRWMVELRDRYSWWHRILPLLLTSLHDNLQTVRARAEELWEAAGQQYAQENESDPKFKDKMDFCANAPLHYPPGRRRPNLGCRTLAQQTFHQLVNGIVRELDDWVPEIRLRSAQLLAVLMVNAEDGLTQHLGKLVPALARALGRREDQLQAPLATCARCLGLFVRPDVLWTFCATDGAPTSLSGLLRLRALALGACVRSPEQRLLLRAAEELRGPEICQTRRREEAEGALECCEALLGHCGPDDVSLVPPLYATVFTVLALSSSPDLAASSLRLLSLLATKFSLTSHQLHLRHLRDLFLDSDDEVPPSSTSVRCQTLLACLRHAPLASCWHLDALLPLVSDVLRNSEDAELRLRLLSLLTRTLEVEGAVEVLGASGGFVERFLREALLDMLIWKAGRTAEALRTAALACLCVLLERFWGGGSVGDSEEIGGSGGDAEEERSSEGRAEEKRRSAEDVQENRRSGGDAEEERSSEGHAEEKRRSAEGVEETGRSQDYGEERRRSVEDVQENRRSGGDAEEKRRVRSELDEQRRIQAELEVVKSEVLPHLLGLAEDNSRNSRLYALRAIRTVFRTGRCLRLVEEDWILRAYPPVLKRLDDGCNDVRHAAFQTLRDVWLSSPEGLDVVFNHAHVDALYTTLVIHLDDPEEEFKEAALATLKALASVHPKLLHAKLSSCAGNFSNQTGVQAVLRHCETQF